MRASDDENWDWSSTLKDIDDYVQKLIYREFLEDLQKESLNSSKESQGAMKTIDGLFEGRPRTPRSIQFANHVSPHRSATKERGDEETVTPMNRQLDFLRQRNEARRKRALGIGTQTLFQTKLESESEADLKIMEIFNTFKRTIDRGKNELKREDANGARQSPSPEGRHRGKFAIQSNSPASLFPPRFRRSQIIVSNLASSVTQNDLELLFEDIGELYSVRLPRPGVAEVVFNTLEYAEKAIETFCDRLLDGLPINCEVNKLYGLKPQTKSVTVHENMTDQLHRDHKKDPVSVSDYRVVVSNLHSRVTKDDIEDLFGEIGELHEVRMVQPGFADVVYTTNENSRMAVETYRDRMLDRRPLKCWLVSNN